MARGRPSLILLLVALGVGVPVGSAGTYLLLGPSNYAQITVVNGAQSNIARLEVVEDRFGNRYLAENLAPGASVTFPVFAWGELGYRIEAVNASGDTATGEFYAEAGYRVSHVVTESSIFQDTSAY